MNFRITASACPGAPSAAVVDRDVFEKLASIRELTLTPPRRTPETRVGIRVAFDLGVNASTFSSASAEPQIAELKPSLQKSGRHTEMGAELRVVVCLGCLLRETGSATIGSVFSGR